MPITSRLFVQYTVLLLAIGIAALVAIVGTSLWRVERTQDYVREVVVAREIRSAIVDLRSFLQDAEIDQRGYLLTSEESYLAPYADARSQIAPALDKVRSLSAGFPGMASHVNDLTVAIKERLVDLDRSVELQENGRRDEALEVLRSGAGQANMSAVFDILVEQADQRLIDRIEDQHASAASLRWVTIVGALVIFLVVGGSTWTVLRYTRDLAASRNEIEKLATGLEERVAERTADLGRANEQIQRFAYIVTHDLRAPLVNIMGFTSELEASLEPIRALLKKAEDHDEDEIARNAKAAVAEDLPEAIGFIRSSTTKMDGLIKAILKLSREGRRPLKPERIELGLILQASADTIQHQVGEVGGEIGFDVRVPSVISDRVALEQVFGNLLDNAVKYRSPSRPLRLEVRAKPALADRILIEIEDNGRGIAPQDHERVFELFRRSGPQDQAGEGIGLAHVRSMVRNLGGDVTLKSQLGEGTTFKINLPRDLDAVIRSNAT